MIVGNRMAGKAWEMARQSTSSEKYFRLYESGWRKRFARDWWVFKYLLRIFWLWLTVGGKLRRQKRRAARQGRVFHIDHIAGGGAK
jgi:hypothetical protein